MQTSEIARMVSTAKEYYWPTFARDASFFDLPTSIITSAEGLFVVDIHGNRYLDTIFGSGAMYLGYNHPEVMEAMLGQMKRVASQCTFFVPTPPAILLAEKIASLTPGSLKYTIFGSNGTDANETAIKIARQYWKIKGQGTKYKVIGRKRNYHGMGLGTLSASGHMFRRAPFEPLMPGFILINSPICYRCPYDLTYPECGVLCAQELRRAIEFEHPSTVACYIGEQTIGGGGVVPPPPEYMKIIRDICDEYDVLLIADEVITGFGKTGFWFECQKYGIVPDIITMGKGIGAGYGPLSGTHVKSEIAELFKGKDAFQHGYTFGGLGYLAAAGLAAIEYVERHNLLARATELGTKIRQELEAIKEGSAVVGDVRVNGVMAAVELVKDKATKAEFPDRAAVARLVADVGLKNGVLLNCLTWYGDIILLFLPLNTSDEELGMVFHALAQAVAEVERRFL